jgi:Protein of unknown function (DUF3631)
MVDQFSDVSVTRPSVKGELTVATKATNVVQMPAQDAKARADAETEDKRQLFKWADELLQQIGAAQKVAAAKSVDAVRKLKLDVGGVDVEMAMRTALHPVGGERARHFKYLTAVTLKRVLKMRFEEMQRYREMEIERGSVGAQYDAAICLPDVILAVINEYVELREHEAVAGVLWSLHTHVFDRFMITPRLALRSPKPGCGKTTFLDVLALLCQRGKRIDHTTAAALFRGIDRHHPSVMIDEGDNLDIVGAIRSVMNSGHRKGGVFSRFVDGEDRDFSTFAPMAVGVIGTLPETLLQRSIVINMRRSLRTDLRKFDIDNPHIDEVVKPIHYQMGNWARTQPALNPNPDLPKKLRNRVSDNWLVLFSIADCFGEAWGKKARDAAATFLRTVKDDDLSIVMLDSIRRAFDDVLKDDRCRVEQLIETLHGFHDAPWNEYAGHRGTGVPHKIKDAEVTKLLEKYSIHPGTVWPKQRKRGDESKSFRGYMRSWFEDAWARYCSDDEDDE